MAEARPEVSVVIVNWNSGETLGRCLGSVAEATRGIRAEVLVVDNASSDGSAEKMAGESGARLIRNRENVGFARAANRGLSEAKGEVFLLLNPDAEIGAKALGALLRLMREEGQIGIAGCGSVDSAGKEAPGYEMSFPGQRGVAVAQRESQGRDVAWVSGACLAARGEMVEEIGRLDEGFFMYCEDVDWCWRAREAGWRVVTVPGVTIRHELGRSSAQVSSGTRARWAAESRVRFYQEHYPAWRVAWLRLGMAASALLGMAWRLGPAVFSGGAREGVGVQWAMFCAAVGGSRERGGAEE